MVSSKKFFIILFFAVLVFNMRPAFASEGGVVDFLPIFGDDMRKMGQKPPKPFFVSPIFFYMEDYMNVTDVNASGNFSGMDIPANVNMNNVSLNSTTIGGRAGFWLFPFLQIFGLVLYTDGYTTFDASTGRVCMPGLSTCDDSQSVLPRGYNIKQKLPFNAMTYAIGANVAYGMKIGPFLPFVSLNGNYAMSKANLLNEMISTVVLSARFGDVINITNNLSLNVWIGGMYKYTATSNKVSGKYTVHLSEADLAGGALAGNPGGLDVESSYTANQDPVSPWNMVAGLSVKPCDYFDIMVELGFIGKFTTNVGLSFNF